MHFGSEIFGVYQGLYSASSVETNGVKFLISTHASSGVVELDEMGYSLLLAGIRVAEA